MAKRLFLKQVVTLIILLCSFYAFKAVSQEDFRIMPGQFEPSQGVLLAWDYTPDTDPIIADIADAARRSGQVWMLYYPEYASLDAVQIQRYLLNRGVGAKNISFMPAWTNTLWIRDYGPLTIYKGESPNISRHIVNNEYTEIYRPHDDSIPQQLADYWGWVYDDLPLQLEGGNLIFDGLGRCFAGKRILDQNPHLTEEQVAETLKEYFGLREVVFIEKLENSGGGIWKHIDMLMKMIDHETILVSQLPETAPDYQVLENIAADLAAMKTGFGTPYRVFRIPIPPNASGRWASTLNDEMRSYTNALTLNDVVVVPSYNLPNYDNRAKAIYEKLMPGYDVRLVDARALTRNEGAIHCVTMQVPDEHYFRVIHKPVRGKIPYSNGVEFLVEISANTPIDNVRLFYKTSRETAYRSAEMRLSPRRGWIAPSGREPQRAGQSRDYYEYALQDVSASDMIEYYIEAYSGDVVRTVPIVGEKGPYKFYFSSSE
jgi:agmatine/peptidylarginine deiminase